MAKSTYLSNLLLNATLGQAGFPGELAPTGVTPRPTVPLYLALFTTIPIADGTSGTEVSGTGYARLRIDNTATMFPTTINGSKSNAQAFTFGSAGGTWGTITSFGFYDALTGGNLLWFGSLVAPMNIASGDVLAFPASTIVISES